MWAESALVIVVDTQLIGSKIGFRFSFRTCESTPSIWEWKPDNKYRVETEKMGNVQTVMINRHITHGSQWIFWKMNVEYTTKVQCQTHHIQYNLLI